MKRSWVYTLLITVPPFLLVLTNLLEANTIAQYERIQLSRGEQLLFFITPPVAVALLLFLFCYSLRFANLASYRILLGSLTAISIIAAVYLNFFNPAFLPVRELAIVLIMQDMAKYAGYYGGTLLFTLLLGRREALAKGTSQT